MNKKISAFVFYTKTIILLFFVTVNLSYANAACQYIAGTTDSKPIVASYFVDNPSIAIVPSFLDKLDMTVNQSIITLSENNRFIITAPSNSQTPVSTYEVNKNCQRIGKPTYLSFFGYPFDNATALIQQNKRLYTLLKNGGLLSYQYDIAKGTILYNDKQQFVTLSSSCNHMAYSLFEINPQIYVTCGNIMYSFNANNLNDSIKTYKFNHELGKIKIYPGGLIFVINPKGKTLNVYNAEKLSTDDQTTNLPVYSYTLKNHYEIPADFELTYYPLKSEGIDYKTAYALFITSGFELYLYTVLPDGTIYPGSKANIFNLNFFQPIIASTWSANTDFKQIFFSNIDFRIFLMQKPLASTDTVWQSVMLQNSNDSDLIKFDYIPTKGVTISDPQAMTVAFPPI